MDYRFKVLTDLRTDGFLSVECLDLTGCYTQGNSVKELVHMIQDALATKLELPDRIMVQFKNAYIDERYERILVFELLRQE